MTVEEQVDRFGLAFRAMNGRVVLLDGLGVETHPIALAGWAPGEFRSLLFQAAAELYRAEIQAGIRNHLEHPATKSYRP